MSGTAKITRSKPKSKENSCELEISQRLKILLIGMKDAHDSASKTEEQIMKSVQ